MKIYQLLVENRVDFLESWFVNNQDIISLYKIWHNDRRLQERIESDFKFFIRFDPTISKKYSGWLLKNYISFMKLKQITNHYSFSLARTSFFEDLSKYKEYLTIYHKVKNGLSLEQRDINKLSLNDLKDIALQYKEKENEVGTKNEVLDKKYKINENEDYLVYMFKTATQDDFKMYQLVSTNTEWCTRPNYDTFKNYINRSPLFIFINKKNREEKYQFHEQSEQFMDKNDNEIDDKLKLSFIKLINKYLPEDFAMKIRINNSFGFIDKKGNIIAKGFKDAWSFYEGFAWVQFQDNSWGFINNKGNILAKGFKNVWSFYEGFARVIFQDDSWGYIDKKGNIYERNKKTLINKNDPRLKGIEIYSNKFI